MSEKLNIGDRAIFEFEYGVGDNKVPILAHGRIVGLQLQHTFVSTYAFQCDEEDYINLMDVWVQKMPKDPISTHMMEEGYDKSRTFFSCDEYLKFDCYGNAVSIDALSVL